MLHYMIGQVAALLFNINKKKGARSKGGWDFVPGSRISGRKQTPQEMKLAMMSMATKEKPTTTKKKRVSAKTGRQLAREAKAKNAG